MIIDGKKIHSRGITTPRQYNQKESTRKRVKDAWARPDRNPST